MVCTTFYDLILLLQNTQSKTTTFGVLVRDDLIYVRGSQIYPIAACLFILQFVNTFGNQSYNVQLNPNVVNPMRTFLKAFSFFGITMNPASDF